MASEIEIKGEFEVIVDLQQVVVGVLQIVYFGRGVTTGHCSALFYVVGFKAFFNYPSEPERTRKTSIFVIGTFNQHLTVRKRRICR